MNLGGHMHGGKRLDFGARKGWAYMLVATWPRINDNLRACFFIYKVEAKGNIMEVPGVHPLKHN